MQKHWIHEWESKLRASIPTLSDALERDLNSIRTHILQSPTYVFRNRFLQDCAERIADENDLNRLTDHLAEVGAAAGFKDTTLFLLRQGDLSAFKTRVCTTYSEQWLELYGRAHYQYVDPIIARALEGGEPFQFSEVKGTSPLEIEFWANASRHGVGCDGLVIPVTLPCNAQIAVSFSSRVGATGVEMRSAEHVCDLKVIAEIASQRFGLLARNSPACKSRLNEEELEFLRVLVISDDPQGAMSTMSCLASVRSIQTRILEKLGVPTILQAVALACLHQWFDDSPFVMSDVKFAEEEPKRAVEHARLAGEYPRVAMPVSEVFPMPEALPSGVSMEFHEDGPVSDPSEAFKR